MSYSVGQVAELTGVTIRTLHHYGQIGLLEPQERTSAGYRMYSDADLDRLQHILFYRELGFPYLSDERFTRTYEDVAPGLARWLRDAIHANADRRDNG